MKMTIEQIINGSFIMQQNKHELGEDWAENQVNDMNNLEFLERLSDAIEERLEYHIEELQAILRKAQEK